MIESKSERSNSRPKAQEAECGRTFGRISNRVSGRALVSLFVDGSGPLGASDATPNCANLARVA
jgi:hypothetical protein